MLDGYSSVIAAGGDGSINEVVNGMLRAADEAGSDVPPFGILPLGSANDLIDNLKLPEKLDEAANVIAAGRTRRLDLGQVNDRYFDNIVDNSSGFCRERRDRGEAAGSSILRSVRSTPRG